MHVSETCLKSRVLFHPQYSARFFIVVYARGGVICAEGLHFSAFHNIGERLLFVQYKCVQCLCTINAPVCMHAESSLRVNPDENLLTL